jgi:hypothetical protein
MVTPGGVSQRLPDAAMVRFLSRQEAGVPFYIREIPAKT